MNKLGLHARPAVVFVRCVMTFGSEVYIMANNKRYHAGRIMDLLLANLNCGKTFTLVASGPDAAEAVERLERLLGELRDAEL